jgi:hypothetical protein
MRALLAEVREQLYQVQGLMNEILTYMQRMNFPKASSSSKQEDDQAQGVG